MSVKSRKQRERELSATMLENRSALYAAYANAIGRHPDCWLTDAEIIRQMIRVEFSSKSDDASDDRAVMRSDFARNP
jgi:hypothetical protein